MFLVAWWLTGVFLGWFFWKLYRALRSERQRLARDAYSATRLDAFKRAVLGILNDILAQHEQRLGLPLHEDRPKDLIRPSVDTLKRRLAGLVVIALLVIALAAATDNAQLYEWMLDVKSYFVGVREQALLVGLLSGAVFRRYRGPLGGFGRRLGNAVIGDKNNTAWALQSALAIGLIAIVIFAARPDFLSYLRSFKLGTVEATFAEQGTSLREASLNLRDFRAKLFVNQFSLGFESFEESKFISKRKARSRSRRLLGEHTESWTRETDAIAELLFDDYVRPVLTSVACLDELHARRTAIHDPNLSNYVSAWEDFLLQVHNQSSLTEYQIENFLKALTKRSAPFIDNVRRLAPQDYASKPKADQDRIRELVPDCVKIVPEATQSSQSATVAKPDEMAAKIHSHFTKALSALKKYNGSDAAQLSLIVFEPYVTAPIAELISLVSGEREKADFLQNILHGFPPSENLGTAGIINLHYQVTDSQLNSIGSLPLDLMVEQIQYATRSAKNLMRESQKQLTGNRLRSGGIYSRKKIGEGALTEIYDTFLGNAFITQRAEIDIYVQSVLDGETISPKHRQNWITATSRVLATLQQQSDLPKLTIDGLPRVELDRFEADRTRKAKFDPDYVLQANLSIALSAILLNNGTRPGAQNCNTALFHVNQASLSIKPTVEDAKLTWALENRLREWVRAVANRVGESCGWNDAR